MQFCCKNPLCLGHEKVGAEYTENDTGTKSHKKNVMKRNSYSSFPLQQFLPSSCFVQYPVQTGIFMYLLHLHTFTIELRPMDPMGLGLLRPALTGLSSRGRSTLGEQVDQPWCQWLFRQACWTQWTYLSSFVQQQRPCSRPPRNQRISWVWDWVRWVGFLGCLSGWLVFGLLVGFNGSLCFLCVFFWRGRDVGI